MPSSECLDTKQDTQHAHRQGEVCVTQEVIGQNQQHECLMQCSMQDAETMSAAPSLDCWGKPGILSVCKA